MLTFKKVVAAVEETYRHCSETFLTKYPKPGIAYIFIPKRNHIEIVVGKERGIAAVDITFFKSMREMKRIIWVVVPLHGMGEAHKVFRGHVDKIQPWWFDVQSKKVKFGTVEIP